MQKKKKIIMLSAILIVELAVLLYFGFQKKGMHFDEFFSYFNTNNSFGREAYDRTWVSSDNIKKDFYVIPGEGFNYKWVATLQSYDVHPPVYYILLHTICSFFPYVYSMWFGIGLNIFILMLCTVFLYLVAVRFTCDDLLAALILLSVILTPGFISNAMFIRMYALMTLWMVIQVYLHIRMSEYEDFSVIPIKLPIISAIITLLGFLTHYFYLVFWFFIELFFFIPKLKEFKKNLKKILIYISLSALSGVIGIILFPACLGQVNSGYRGVEVKGYLFDVSDMGMRMRFFGGLIDRFVFNGLMYAFILLLCVFMVTAYYRKHSSLNDSENMISADFIGTFVRCIVLPVAGYFLISAKCSLIGDEAMMRYQLPIYPLITMGFCIAIYMCIRYIIRDHKRVYIICMAIFALYILTDIFSLAKGNVYYLYKEQEDMVRIAESNSNEVCVYIYNNDENLYFIWSDANQLWQYDNIYFADYGNKDIIDDTRINDAKRLIVYISKLGRTDDVNEYINYIIRSNNNVASYKLLYESQYAEAYELYP